MKIIGIVLIFTALTAGSLWADHFQFVSLEYPPLEFKGNNGKAEGIAVDIVTTIMTNLGHTVDIEILPWTRALNRTKVGKADAIFTAYKNAERETFLDYSKTILVPQIVALYALKESDIVYDGDLTKLKKFRIGVVSTISYGKKFDSIRDQLNVKRAESMESNFKKLNAKRIELVISNIYQGDFMVNKMGLQNDIKKLSPVVQSVDSFIGFSKLRKLTALRDQFDTELKKLIANGTYDSIMAEYGIVK